MQKTYKWYFEDFVPGQTLQLGSRTVSEEEIVAFAAQFDPQPFHLDADAAQHSIFGGIIASGWHTCGLMMRIVVDSYLNEAHSMGSPGIEEIRWIVPVRGGDTLTVSIETLESKPSTSKSDRGVTISIWRAHNQHGQLVATIKCMGMFGRRLSA